jgi:acetaldehyde dehydrogenase (acetylating)
VTYTVRPARDAAEITALLQPYVASGAATPELAAYYGERYAREAECVVIERGGAAVALCVMQPAEPPLVERPTLVVQHIVARDAGALRVIMRAITDAAERRGAVIRAYSVPRRLAEMIARRCVVRERTYSLVFEAPEGGI